MKDSTLVKFSHLGPANACWTRISFVSKLGQLQQKENQYLLTQSDIDTLVVVAIMEIKHEPLAIASLQSSLSYRTMELPVSIAAQPLNS